MPDQEQYGFARQELRDLLTNLGLPFEFVSVTAFPGEKIYVSFSVQHILDRARATNTVLDLQEIIKGLEPQ